MNNQKYVLTMIFAYTCTSYAHLPERVITSLQRAALHRPMTQFRTISDQPYNAVVQKFKTRYEKATPEEKLILKKDVRGHSGVAKREIEDAIAHRKTAYKLFGLGLLLTHGGIYAGPGKIQTALCAVGMPLSALGLIAAYRAIHQEELYKNYRACKLWLDQEEGRS